MVYYIVYSGLFKEINMTLVALVLSVRSVTVERAKNEQILSPWQHSYLSERYKNTFY